MKTARRAFTLIEAMVVMAIAGIVAVAATMTMSLVLRTMSSTRAAIAVDNAMGQTVQFMSKDIENAGGNGMRGQASVIVDNDNCASRDDIPACGGTDRVTIFSALPDSPVCAVRQGSRAKALSFQYVQGGCCFPSQVSLPSSPPSPTPTTSTVQGLVMLENKRGGFRPVRVSGIAGAVCEFDVVDLLSSDHYLNDPTPSVHTATGVDEFDPFFDGTATLVQMRTFFVDPVEHELRVKDGVAAGSLLLADHVHDLQIAIGHDLDGDGLVADSEFAWRNSAVPAATSFVQRLHAPREVLLSIVQGHPEASKPDTVTSPLRPLATATITSPGEALRTGFVRLVPYNAVFGSTP